MLEGSEALILLGKVRQHEREKMQLGAGEQGVKKPCLLGGGLTKALLGRCKPHVKLPCKERDRNSELLPGFYFLISCKVFVFVFNKN